MGGRSSKAEVSYDVIESSERSAADPGASGNGSGGSGSGSPSGSPSDSPGRSAAPAGHVHSPTPSLQFPIFASDPPMPLLFPSAAPAQTTSASSSPPSSPTSRPSGTLHAGSADTVPTAVILASTQSFPSLRDWGNAPIPYSGQLSSPSVRLWENLPVNPSTPLLLPPPQQASSWAPVQQGPPPALPSGWAFDIDAASGFPYFYNTDLRVTQWEDPRGRGWGLPDAGNSSSSQLEGQEGAQLPPWEGGGAQGDPLQWPLPPGWSRIEDPTSGRQYFVNYDAQILQDTDPRTLIASSIVQPTPVQHVQVAYPPPWADVPVARGQQAPLPVPEPPSPATDSEWRPTPPAPIPGRQPNLWWKLRRGDAGAESAGASRAASLLRRDANEPVPRTGNRAAKTKSRKKHHRTWVGGTREGGGSSSSSSSSSESDRARVTGGVLAGLTGVLVAGGLTEAVHNARNRVDSSSSDGGTSGDENDDDPDALLAASGLETILAYGGAGPRDWPGGGRGGFGTGARVRRATIVQSEATTRSIKPRTPPGGWHRIRRRGRKRKETHGTQRFRDDLYHFFDSILKKADSVCGFLLVLLCLLFLPALWTLSYLSSKCASKISYFGRSRIWKAGTLVALESRQYCFRRLLNMPSSRSSLTWRFARFLGSLCFKLQVGYYRHLCCHQHPRVRALTVEDGVGPLQSSLPRVDREITIVTQASADRLPAVEAMASSWGGPLCVAVYVHSKKELEQVYAHLCTLHAKIEDMGRCKLHICVAMEEHENAVLTGALYPVNSMRNIALQMATTELVFLLDADFVPSPGLHESLTKEEDWYQSLLTDAKLRKRMFAVAAFESAGNSSFFELDDPLSRMPQTYEGLKDMWCDGLGRGFHCGHFPQGHQPTDYECFFKESTSEPYMIPYREFYEPYVICARTCIPQFDERFTGYGLNKISHAYHCASLGMTFHVLTHHFVWAVPHPRSQSWSQTFGFDRDPLQVLRIQGLYYQFKRELARSDKNAVGSGWITKATLTTPVQYLLDVYYEPSRKSQNWFG